MTRTRRSKPVAEDINDDEKEEAKNDKVAKRPPPHNDDDNDDDASNEDETEKSSLKKRAKSCNDDHAESPTGAKTEVRLDPLARHKRVKTSYTLPLKSSATRRALELVRQGDNLPTLYAALQILQESGDLSDFDDWPSNEDKDLVQNALLAVPYLLFRQVEQGMEAGGTIRAHEMALQIFQAMGPQCCQPALDHKSLLTACPFLSRSEGWQILPVLKAVGQDAQSRLDELRRSL